MDEKRDDFKKQTVVEGILNSLLSDVSSGVYKAGDKIPNEYVLTEKFNCSRNSLREAIRSLCTMGILQIKRGDGTYVCSQIAPSIFDSAVYNMISGESSVNEMLELRQIIDETTVAIAIDKMSDEELANANDNIEKMQHAIEIGNMELAKTLDYEFHIILIESCKNSFFIRIAKGVYSIFKHSIGENVSLERVDSLAPYFHKKMLSCIQKKDYTSIKKTVENSLITWRERIQ